MGQEKAGGAKQPLVNLKEKAAQFNADSKIQALLQQINREDSTLDPQMSAPFSAQNADTLRAVTFDAEALATQPLPYEKLDRSSLACCSACARSVWKAFNVFPAPMGWGNISVMRSHAA